MRTTLTLDDDLAYRLQEAARQTGRSFKAVVNETLRRGFALGDSPAASPPPFRIEAKARGFRPGVDILKLNQLADELEVERFEQKSARAGAG